VTDAAFDYAYTDRHVREYPTLKNLAEEYVRTYGGDFDPLVGARIFFEANGYLTTGMARMVLNCMRHDRNVCAELPTPLAPITSLDVVRAAMRIARCPNEQPHYAHMFKPVYSDRSLRCEGTPFVINRIGVVQTSASIKYGFAVSRSRSLIHRTAGYGIVSWLSPLHAWGTSGWNLSVKLACKCPSWLKNPLLFKDEPRPGRPSENEWVIDPAFFPKRCTRCFADSNPEESTSGLPEEADTI
jgi:hypothetical protein